MTQIIFSPSKLIPEELRNKWENKKVDWTDPQKRIEFAAQLSLEYQGKNSEVFYREYETKQAKYHKRSVEEGFAHLILRPSTNIEQPATLAVPFDETQLRPIFAKLEASPVPGIIFDRQLVNKSKILKGICTSITLDWIEQFLLLSKQKADLIDRVTAVAERYLMGGDLGIAYRQTVFNTIAYDQKHPVEDPLHAKVQAMANLHGLKLLPCTDEMEQTCQVCAARKELPDGIYLLRMINTIGAEITVRGENYGHSIALIKEAGKTFLEDPNYGLVELPEDESGEKAFMSILKNFWFTSYRFYRASLATEDPKLSVLEQDQMEKAKKAAKTAKFHEENLSPFSAWIRGWLG